MKNLALTTDLNNLQSYNIKALKRDKKRKKQVKKAKEVYFN